MGDIVNLRQARKGKLRENAEQRAAQNRFAFGLTKQQKREAAALQNQQIRQLDGHMLDGRLKPEDKA